MFFVTRLGTLFTLYSQNLRTAPFAVSAIFIMCFALTSYYALQKKSKIEVFLVGIITNMTYFASIYAGPAL